ncbi:hypothetical protein [Pseudomonas donghuensis]|nr:hypothetical protein [Pseudomonas donghuensis]MDF9893389.1 hypothetical protein [Pseudomonas vranovensis]
MNDLQTDTIESTTTSELPALSLFASVTPVSGYDAGVPRGTCAWV